ncbi:MAG TPA: hypothetical protein VK528_02140 [Flavobacterium sp.]|nr:hypothetical protein [Flavobacterium sp.]
MATEKPGREDRPTNINPDEVNNLHPAKTMKAQEKVAIKESGLGREQGQTPAEEHIESRLSQIDEGTKDLHSVNPKHKSDIPQTETDTDKNQDAGYMNDANSSIDRDTGDSTKEGWEAEISRTGRHK